MQAHKLTTAAPQLVELIKARGHITCALGCIVIVYSGRSPDAAYLDRSAGIVNAYGTKFPDGLGLMVLISANEPPPDEPTRRAIQASYAAMQQSIRAAVLVVEGEGFVAAAKRSIITVLSLTNSLSFPIKVSGTPLDGAAKLAQLLGPRLAPGIDHESVASAAAQIRRGVTSEFRT